ncbi:GntR family transcriptional regulator [Azospirillum thiophilum]|nr:GntR family transcriptional regulator [Azospirillum thiophilum]
MTTDPPSDIGAAPAKRPGRRAQRAVIMSTDGSRPLYKEVKLAITRILSAGEVGGGDAIPTEKQLSERFGVSVGTIRKAIDELVAERVLIRQQGRGTFLAPLSPERMLNYFWHIVRKDGTREVPIVQTLGFQGVPADAETAARLGIPPGAGIFRIRNLLLLGGEPVIIDDIRIAQAMFPGLTEADFVSRDTTVYGLYQSRFNVSVLKAFDRLSAVAADPASAKQLGVALSTPLLQIDRIALTFEDRPVESRRSLLLTDRYEYHNALTSEEH